MASFRPGQRVRHRPTGAAGTFIDYVYTGTVLDCRIVLDEPTLCRCGCNKLCRADVPLFCYSPNLDPLTGPDENTFEAINALEKLQDFKCPTPATPKQGVTP